MKPDMARLYLAFEKLLGKTGQTELARTMGVTPQTIYNWEARGISKQGLLKAQEIIGCSAAWVESGIGTMVLPTMQNFTTSRIGVRQVPLVSFVQAGCWTEVVDNFQPGDAEEWLMTDLSLSNEAFALEIKGDSMLPEFKEGDRVIVDPSIEPMPGDFVVAKCSHEEATFKKYRPRGVNERGEMVIELVPLNEDYPSLRSDVQPITVIGVMVEHRKYRKR